YTYDDNGNWLIKCKKLRNYNYLGQTKPEPKKVTKRRIQYNDGRISKKISREEALCFCVPNYKKRLEKFIEKENGDTEPTLIQDIKEQK
ncbi:hypothetical protein N9954_09565, partial [Maribacter sp.]|nr:hypothetical protein [Maribacter sp.]